MQWQAGALSLSRIWSHQCCLTSSGIFPTAWDHCFVRRRLFAPAVIRFVRIALAGLMAATVAATCGCGGSGSTSAPRPRSTASTTTVGDHACSPAPVDLHPQQPPWLKAARVGQVPYAMASGDPVAAIFAGPLRAGHPTNPANKVLWVVGTGRDGHPLQIAASPDTAGRSVVHIRRPPNAGPGAIYPSYVNLPAPGCWQLALRWGRHHAEMDVQVWPRLRSD